MPNEAGAYAARDDRGLPPLPAPERIQALLFDAARLGRFDIIPALVQAGGGLGVRDPGGYTALILASYHGRTDAMSVLLALGADVDQPDAARGNTALMGVAFKGYLPIARQLLDAGADPNALNHAGQTALMMAALFGHGEIADRLIEAGADPDLRDAAGNSAVSVALAQRNAQMVQRLSGHCWKA
jgi:uncharacterized protein